MTHVFAADAAYPSQLPHPYHNSRTLGAARAATVSAVTAQTSASSRSGERPDDNPPSAKSHISSSSAGNAPAWRTRRTSPTCNGSA